jgi:flagellar basal-body rod protein FlgF/flagellar basal-body rod protein FlgG
MVARQQALDTIANNLANASTVGYRAQKTVFSSVLADAGYGNNTPLDRAINQFGVMGDTTLNLSQGALQKTGNELDVAIQGGGYFVVQTANGEVYTRAGNFQVSGNGQLVTQAGDPVMGDRGEISLVPGRVSISSDGTMSVNGAVTGKFKIVEFPSGTKLSSMGDTYYSAPADTAQDSTDSDVRQGFLESSNVNPVLGMVELVTAQRSAEMMQKAFAMFNSEMDKTATQDLPKVS